MTRRETGYGPVPLYAVWYFVSYTYYIILVGDIDHTFELNN